MACTEGGREGVVEMLAPFPEESTLPIFASSNLTCYLVYTSPLTALNVSYSLSNLRYSAPVPSTLKIARNLFSQAYSGKLLSGSRVCEAGIRVVLSPGLGKSPVEAEGLISHINEDLSGSGIYEKVSARFYYAFGVVTNTTAASATTPAPTPSARLRRRLQSTSKSSTSRRGKWLTKILPVLNGSISCNWTALNITHEAPYLRVDDFCLLHRSKPSSYGAACLMTLLAYLSAEPTVMYLEAFPVVSTFNVYASGIAQSGSVGNLPLFNAGINGTGQILQVSARVMAAHRLAQQRVYR